MPDEHQPLTVRLFSDIAAKQNGFDVVLIDTAGRMQDNEPLMRALAKVRFESRWNLTQHELVTG